MKTRILIAALSISFLLNVAGLVFFIFFLKTDGHYRTMRRERNQMAQSLNQIRLAMLTGNYGADKLQKRSFISHVDGVADTFGVLTPTLGAQAKDLTLVVYLHGMGSNYLEPFFYPQGAPVADAVAAKDPQTVFMSCSYRREASWGNDAAMSDISQNIRQVMQEYSIGNIVIMGTSMGGCTALTYAATAPDDIKSKIAGVLSVESAGDLLALYNESSHPSLKQAMIVAFGGTPEQKPETFRAKSFLSNIEGLPATAKVVVVSAREDSIVPPSLQKKIVEELERHKRPVKLVEIDGGHGAPPSSFYTDGLDYILGKGT